MKKNSLFARVTAGILAGLIILSVVTLAIIYILA